MFIADEDIDGMIARAAAEERERCAKIAESVTRFTGALTLEREYANRVLPRVAAAIRDNG